MNLKFLTILSRSLFLKTDEKTQGLFLCLFSRFIIDLLIFTKLQTSNPSQMQGFWGNAMDRMIQIEIKYLAVRVQKVWLLTCLFLLAFGSKILQTRLSHQPAGHWFLPASRAASLQRLTSVPDFSAFITD